MSFFIEYNTKARSYARSKTKNGVFRSGFFDQKKNIYRFSSDKIVFFFPIEKSRSKNAVFRFRSAFSISRKIGPNRPKSQQTFQDWESYLVYSKYTIMLKVIIA